MFEAGQLISDRYRLIGRVGTGGMAEVWLAEDTMLHRRVALKFLADRFEQDAQFVERFRREASAAAGLQHPNVVGVFDRGEHEGRHYIVMEYVEGASLKDLIGRSLSVGEAVEIIRQVLAGARFAHARGIIHRDLKPQNVLIDAEGRARVADFGIARAGASEITQTGSVLGTAQYLSPEQAQGMAVTAASDLYSIGVMLYEALTGQVPFEGDSAVSVALKQVSERPRPPSELNPEVPPALDSVVLRALAKDPANRFASADEFLRALQAAEADPQSTRLADTASYAPVVAPVPPPPLPPAGRRRLLTRGRAIALVLLLLLAGGALAYALTRPSSVLVPTVIGKDEAQATAILKKAGFQVHEELRQTEQPRGTVLEQDPTAGSRADDGSTVTLTVSSGPGRARVLDVRGQPAEAAGKALTHQGFKVDAVDRHSATVRSGLVITTDPPPGTPLARGKTVKLIVSQGPNLVSVPDVTGDTEATAQGALTAAGLRSSVTKETSDQPAGQVVSQDPAAGSQVPRGQTVTIVVSKGPGTVVVQNVVGKPEASAAAALEGQGLKVRTVSETTDQRSQDGRVLDQTPGAGRRVPRGYTVTIFVGRFQETSTTTTTTTSTP